MAHHLDCLSAFFTDEANQKFYSQHFFNVLKKQFIITWRTANRQHDASHTELCADPPVSCLISKTEARRQRKCFSQTWHLQCSNLYMTWHGFNQIFRHSRVCLLCPSECLWPRPRLFWYPFIQHVRVLGFVSVWMYFEPVLFEWTGIGSGMDPGGDRVD